MFCVALANTHTGCIGSNLEGWVCVWVVVSQVADVLIMLEGHSEGECVKAGVSLAATGLEMIPKLDKTNKQTAFLAEVIIMMRPLISCSISWNTTNRKLEHAPGHPSSWKMLTGWSELWGLIAILMNLHWSFSFLLLLWYRLNCNLRPLRDYFFYYNCLFRETL